MTLRNRPTTDDRPLSRRTLLRASAVALTGALAGCASGDDDPTTTPAANGTETPTDAPTTTDPSGTATPTTTPDDESLRATAEAFVEDLGAKAFDAATEAFAPALFEQVDADALASVWSDVERQFGAFVGVEGSTVTSVQGRRAVVVTTRFAQALQGIRVVFDDRARVAGFQFVPVDAPAEWSPPDYVNTDAFETTTVSLDGPGDCSLPGELAVPVDTTAEGAGVPGVVVLGGSGPTDLDGSLGPNRPYRDLAYGLASDGVASLRYTKRTAVCSVDPAALTIDDEYTTDALTAVARLRETPGVDPERIVVLGHSLGASLAPRVAAEADGVVGVGMLAPPGRPLQDAVVAQTRYLAELDGTVTDEERARIDAVTAAAERVDDLDIEDGETVLGGGRPYWESLASYDAVATARGLSVPLFLGFGGRDYQVPTADRDRWREALAGESGVTVETYDDLNHLFIPGSGPSSPEEYRTLGHITPRVVTDLASWVRERDGR